jgi:hypothetical protein
MGPIVTPPGRFIAYASVNGIFEHALQKVMRKAFTLLLCGALAGCSAIAPQRSTAPAAIVASPFEPAAQLDAASASYAEGALLGAAGGAGIGAMSGKASAGLLCTIGGPLCLIVVVPAAIVGSLVGGVAGAALDAIATDPRGRIKDARGTIEQAVADMRLTDSLAARTSELSKTPLASRAAVGAQSILEVGVSELEILAREKDMALVLRGRSRLLREGEVLEERVAEAQTGYRKYQDWAQNEAQPLRTAVDAALADLGRALLSAQAESAPRRDTSARRGG